MSIASAYNCCWFFEKKLTKVEKNTKVEKISYQWRRSQRRLTFFWERSKMDGKEPLQEHISVLENLLYNIHFLLIKFPRIRHTGVIFICVVFSFLSDGNHIFKDKCSIWVNRIFAAIFSPRLYVTVYWRRAFLWLFLRDYLSREKFKLFVTHPHPCPLCIPFSEPF